jgi:hypothetical protein
MSHLTQHLALNTLNVRVHYLNAIGQMLFYVPDHYGLPVIVVRLNLYSAMQTMFDSRHWYILIMQMNLRRFVPPSINGVRANTVIGLPSSS